MAQAAKGKGKKSSNTKPKSTKGSGVRTQSKPASAQKQPRRREIGALVCLFLGVFALLNCFGVDAAFISFFCKLIKGLVGWGFYSAPVVLFACALILGFHKGRPVAARVVCLILVSVMVGAIAHLFFCKIDYSLADKMFSALWMDGRSMMSGGILGGTLAEAFAYLFHPIGAGIIFFCLLIFFCIVGCNRSVSDIARAVK